MAFGKQENSILKKLLDSKTYVRCALACLMGALAFGPATGCVQQGRETGTPEKITIAYSTSFNAALIHIALIEGFFAQEGLDATPQPHAFGKRALQSVLDGKADVATASDTPIMFAIMNSGKVSILAGIETSNRSNAIVARKDRGIAGPSDLKGKRIGVALGTTADFFTEIFLTAHGVDRRKLRIVDMNPDEMGAALGSGKIDAAAAWNPALAKMQNDLGGRGQTLYGETLYTETFCVVAARDFIQAHPRAVEKILRALIRAEAFVRDHPGESRRVMAEFLKADPALLDRVWEGYNYQVSLDQALIVDLEDQTRWAMKHRWTARKSMPNYRDFIHVGGLYAVKPDAVTIIR
jgi:ABC-type nitrate/sulfonate/bicarbonate transport system substrate-binding protein